MPNRVDRVMHFVHPEKSGEFCLLKGGGVCKFKFERDKVILVSKIASVFFEKSLCGDFFFTRMAVC
jgi:hypothetical protein